MNDQNDRAELTPEELQELRERKQAINDVYLATKQIAEAFEAETGYNFTDPKTFELMRDGVENPQSQYKILIDKWLEIINRVTGITFTIKDDPEDGGAVNAAENQNAAAVNAAEIKKYYNSASTQAITSYPVDKLSTALFYNNQQKLINTLTADEQREGKQALIYFDIDFTKEEGLKAITSYEKRLIIAIGSLYGALNKRDGILYTTTKQIYKAMGNTTPIGKNAHEKIIDTLRQLRATPLVINNHEHKDHKELNKKSETRYKGDEYAFIYEGVVLPNSFEQEPQKINGGKTKLLIKFTEFPPILQYANKQNKIAAVPLKVFNTPLSQTATTLGIEDYLIQRISNMKLRKAKKKGGNEKKKGGNEKKKGGNEPNYKINYETITSYCNITGRKAQSQTPKKVKIILEHYKKCNWILDYTEDGNGIIIQL